MFETNSRSTIEGHHRESIHMHRLESGMTVLVIHRKDSPVAACRLFVAAGSRFDRARSGCAHLTEHCLARGATIDKQPVELALESRGAEFVASTHRDFIHFGVSALGDDLPLALEALARICIDPDVEEAIVAHERAVILHEIQQHRDSIEGLWDVLFSAVWDDHPIVAPAVGSPDLQQLGPADVEAHCRTRVRPERAVIAIVSALDPSQALEHVKRCFGGWAPDGAPVPPDDDIPLPRATPARFRLPADLQRAYFLLGWPLPVADNDQGSQMRLLAALLGGGPASLLVQRLRTEAAAVYDVQAVLARFSDACVLAVSGSCAPDNLEPVLATAVDTVTGNGAAPRYEPAVVHSCQVSCCGTLMRHYETATRRAGLLGRSGLWGRPRPLQDRLTELCRITADELESCTQRWLHGVPPAVAVVG